MSYIFESNNKRSLQSNTTSFQPCACRILLLTNPVATFGKKNFVSGSTIFRAHSKTRNMKAVTVP